MVEATAWAGAGALIAVGALPYWDSLRWGLPLLAGLAWGAVRRTRNAWRRLRVLRSPHRLVAEISEIGP